MNNENAWGAFFLGLIIGAFACLMVIAFAVDPGGYWQREAVRHDAGRFLVNDQGEVRFEWNNPEKKP